MYRLADERYVEIMPSIVLPLLTTECATRFLEERKQVPSTVWLRAVRAWVREQRPVGDQSPRLPSGHAAFVPVWPQSA
jgi:hypothetical protein